MLRPNQWLPKDERQQEIFRSRDALYGRATYYAGEMTANLPTYPGSGLSPAKIASIHTEVDTVGRMLPKADLDQQVLRRDSHLEAVDGGLRSAITSKQLLWKPANRSELAANLCLLAEAMVDDIDGFDTSCYRLLGAIGSGYASEEAVFEDKTLHPGDGIEVPGTWPQQTGFIHNRCYRFDPIEIEQLFRGHPVVAAPAGLALGGGCEICLHSSAVQAHAETYIGLVETGVGVIPGGGGSKEFALRLSDELKEGDIRINALRERFLASPWAERTPVEVELSLEVVISGRAVRGRVDAVFADPDGGFTVLDWKTGAEPADAESRRQAAVQLGVYRLAWAALQGCPVDRVRTAFHYVRSGATVVPDELSSPEQLAALLTV